MRSQTSFLIAAVLLLPGAASAQPAIHDSSATVMACPARPIPGCLPKNSVLDTAWVTLGNGMKGCRILNHRDLWAVEMPWMKVDGTARIYRLSELDSLHDAGAITDSTIFSVQRYRFPVKAKSVEEARAAAQSRQPLEPPKEILKAFAPGPPKSQSPAAPAK
jgi:hypothetical protein